MRNRVRKILTLRHHLPYLLNRVSEFAIREFIPQPFNSCQVNRRNVLDISEINKLATLGFGARKTNQGVSCELKRIGTTTGR
jgi:hypothetical protein